MSFDTLHIVLVVAVLVTAFAAFVFAQRKSALSAELEKSRAENRTLAAEQASFVKLRSDFAELKGVSSATERAHLDEIAGLREKSAQLDTIRARFSALEAESAEKEKSFLEQLRLLKDAEANLKQNFENLANRIFEEKSTAFKAQSREHFDALLNPLKTQIGEFKNSVDRTNEGIHTLKALNTRMADEATNLTRALKGDNKTQGGWGEQVLGRILEASGLTEGRDYQSQFSYVDEDRSRRQPDCVIFLPENKAIVVDSKVSLTAYERYSSAETDAARDTALKEHVRSLKTHVDGLSAKSYETLPGKRNLDFVLIFIPVEPAFIDALRQDDSLYTYALDRNIVLAAPSTLLATCRTVAHLQKLDQRNVNAMKIADQAGKLYDEFTSFANDLSEVGRYLEKASSAQASAVKRLSVGRNNVVGQVEKMKMLGAKAKKQLPSEWLDDDDSGLLESDE